MHLPPSCTCPSSPDPKRDPMSTTRTPADLQTFLTEHAPNATLIGDMGETPTVPAAALALAVAPDQIMKTLLFSVETPHKTELVVVISHGERRVDKGVLATQFGVGRKRVSLAPAQLVLATIGYPAGGVPPFGHAHTLPVFLDASVVESADAYASIFYAGGGDDHTMMRLHLADLLRICAPTVLPLSSF